jgi:hypothetical protein
MPSLQKAPTVRRCRCFCSSLTSSAVSRGGWPSATASGSPSDSSSCSSRARRLRIFLCLPLMLLLLLLPMCICLRACGAARGRNRQQCGAGRGRHRRRRRAGEPTRALALPPRVAPSAPGLEGLTQSADARCCVMGLECVGKQAARVPGAQLSDSTLDLGENGSAGCRTLTSVLPWRACWASAQAIAPPLCASSPATPHWRPYRTRGPKPRSQR